MNALFGYLLSKLFIMDTVFSIFRSEEAPKRIDRIFGNPQTYSKAFFGGMEPPPKTCIAMALTFRVRNVSS